MADAYRVEMDTVDGGPTALGRAGSFTLVSDRPASSGGHGLGFNGGQLLNLAVAACISNDLYREAMARGVALSRVRVTVDADYRRRARGLDADRLRHGGRRRCERRGPG